jgi:hypothetical protein
MNNTYAVLAMFSFLSVGAASLFTFLAVTSWSEARRKERESYYRNDMLKKLAESEGTAVNQVWQVLQEQERIARVRSRAGLRLAGLVVIGVGTGLMIFLGGLVPGRVYLCGLIPLLIGCALLAGSDLYKPTAGEKRPSGTI